ncbi:hypothetical protein [Cupriavidus basilensis]|uniref:hypothetical protein n=1 Tax=Cupriavidus basilensis TaxID=68895 RepID=UPI0020C5FB4A|nr:hypothetical protein [Cupriavidus basilensis]
MDRTLLDSMLTPVAAALVSKINAEASAEPPMPEMVAFALFSSEPSVPDETLMPMPMPARPGKSEKFALGPPSPPVPVIEPLLVMVATPAFDTLMPMPAAPAPPMTVGKGPTAPPLPFPPTPEIVPLLSIRSTIGKPGAFEDTLMPVPALPSLPLGLAGVPELPSEPLLEMFPKFVMVPTGERSPGPTDTPGPPATLITPLDAVTFRLLPEPRTQVDEIV